jgi:class 3 adenylate cyclase
MHVQTTAVFAKNSRYRGQPAGPQVAIAAPAHDTAERRQLTVMFCELVGSTALSARLDFEDLRAIIRAYHRCCATLVEQNGGFVAKYFVARFYCEFTLESNHGCQDFFSM